MVLLIGNYPLDRQHSMQRFGEMMLHGLRAAGVDVELVSPAPHLGNLTSGRLRKWLGYIDKYLLFPLSLRRLFRSDSAIVHICDHSNAVYVPRSRARRFVVTCHDLLAVRGGLGEATDCPASFTGRMLQRWILRGLRRADAVACVSTATRSDAERLVRQSHGRPGIELVPLGLNFDYRVIPRAEALGLLEAIPNFPVDSPFVLHVGSNLRRKNREGVLRIFARSKDAWNGRLVLAGDPLDAELSALARELGIADRIVEVDSPPPETLRALYNCATTLLFPSRFEGFGWPIIEAQACGCPVICTNSGPMPEAAGDAGLLHDVDDEAGFATDVVRLTNPEERATWSEKSLRNAQRFTPERMIARYIEIYREAGANL